ncbi:hypothetical protein cypCar_00026259, partial [Cyprinus carpio]
VDILPVQADSPKKPDTQLPSDPEKTASSNSLSATNSDMEEAGQQDTRTQEESEEPKLTCELCGWVDFAYKFKRSKRFCSLVCAKRAHFLTSQLGCQEIADEFRAQEIDGQAMLLLKEDHLMSAMNIKLGPALKIFARINMLKDSKP